VGWSSARFGDAINPVGQRPESGTFIFTSGSQASSESTADPNFARTGRENARPGTVAQRSGGGFRAGLAAAGENERPAFRTAAQLGLWRHQTWRCSIPPMAFCCSPGSTAQVAIARGLVDKALAAEHDGLWARLLRRARTAPNRHQLYFGRRMDPGAAEICRQLGFETTVDKIRHVSRRFSDEPDRHLLRLV